MKVERSVEIAATPERIYEVIMDPSCLARWVTIHAALEEAPDGQLERGSELTQRLQLAGRAFTVHWKVVENHPARRVVWEGSGPMHSHAGVTYELAPNGDGGTRFTYINEFALPGGPLGRIAGSVVRRVTAGELDESLIRLRAMVE
ncbi:MAG TPA: SRPBCC family protein [Thermoleophilaceae bacterium]|nr:SRPBCC family protein [Thermoleophilaceae bacterium]